MPVKATSSGTGGQFSRIGMGAGDLRNGAWMVWKVARHRRLFSPVPCHYIVFGYRPHRSNHTAVTKTAFGATLFTPALSRTYALTYRDRQYVPDLEGVLRAIERYAASRFPLRFMGFPSYTWFTMQMMEERGMCVKLPPVFQADAIAAGNADVLPAFTVLEGLLTGKRYFVSSKSLLTYLSTHVLLASFPPYFGNFAADNFTLAVNTKVWRRKIPFIWRKI